MKTCNKVFMLLAALLWLVACKKEDYAQLNKGDMALAVTASGTSLQLSEKNKNADALTLNWTSGSNKGTNAAIHYILQLAKQGSNFSSPVEFDLGKAVFAKKFTSGELNELLVQQLQATTGTAYAMEARVIAATQSDKVEQEISSPVTINITPYKPVSSTLYLIGDATPNGWDANNATALTALANTPGGFAYSGPLRSGDFKFITSPGNFLPSYNKGANTATLVYRTLDSDPDDKFLVTAAGMYNVTVNLIDLTITVEQANQPAFTKLWIVGDATPNGWNIDNPNMMKLDSSNPYVFNYNEILKVGEFKIPTSTGNWGTDYYMPATNHPALTDQTAVLVPGGSPDNKWQISTAGPYKITLDIGTNKISIKPFTAYTKLWLVGDATPVGWNIDNPEPMKAVAGDPYTFTWQGTLKPGEFKIPTTTGNWGCDYFMPLMDQQGIASHEAKFVPSGSPDHKWRITDAGTYKITFNQFRETIDIVKQ